MSVANIGMTNWSEFNEFIQGAVTLITMFLAGTYLVTYIVSLRATLKNKRISLISLSPIFHKIFVAQKPITFRWWEECHAPFYP